MYSKHSPPFMDNNASIIIGLPPLPEPRGSRPWPADVTDAHCRLRLLFSSARSALNLDESDPIRLKFHLHRATSLMLPLVRALGCREDYPLLEAHVQLLAQNIGRLVIHLRNTLDGAEIRYEGRCVSGLKLLTITECSVNVLRLQSRAC